MIQDNTYSEIAKEIMIAGLNKSSLEVSKDFARFINQELFNVPEKPEEYKPTFEVLIPETAVLVSGGLDSSVLYFRAIQNYQNVRAYYIDIGQPYKDKEMEALDRLGIDFDYINTGLSFNSKLYWKHIIPGRNFYFLALIAEQMRGGGRILFGVLNGEMPKSGGDKSKKFLVSVNKLFKRLPYQVVVETPLENETKTDLVRWWKNNLPLEKLDYTISCFEKKEGHCGECQSCLRKALAYISNGLILKTDVDVRIGCKEYIDKYLKVLGDALKKKDFSHYSKRRCKQDLRAISLLLK